MMLMVKLRGISKRQVHQYWIEKGAIYDGDNYRFPDYFVTITREETKKIRVIPIMELDILFEGIEKSVEEAVKLFRKSFVRMGG
jgi:hypothetical protein